MKKNAVNGKNFQWTEEEKKAINNFKEIIENLDEDEEIVYEEEIRNYKTLLNLIEKQQNKIASLEKQIKLMQNCDLEKVIEKQQKEIDKLIKDKDILYGVIDEKNNDME